jgi:TatD DNase family protein
MLIDSHCHFSFPELQADATGVLDRMHAAGVGMALNISTSMQDVGPVVAFAQAHQGIFASVGIHPDQEPNRDPGRSSGQSPEQNLDQNPENLGATEPDVAALVALASADKVIAIGETGLDYYRLHEPLDWQRERFRTHIRAARQTGKPLVIHTRSSAADTLRIMREEGADAVGGIMHCFTEDAQVAREAMEMGFLISFSGILTFKSAQNLREVAAKIPDDRILVETDSPFLAPIPYRGKSNQPAWVRHVAECLAGVRSQTFEHIAEVTTNNFINLFKVL